MSETTQTVPNFLDIDFSQEDTSMPVLRRDKMIVTCTSQKVEPSKDGSKQNWNLTFKTTSAAQDKEGNTVNAGFPLYHTVSVTETPKYPMSDIRKKVAQVVQSAGVKKMAEVEGKNLEVIVDIEPERTDEKTGQRYEERNRISRFIVPKPA